MHFILMLIILALFFPLLMDYISGIALIIGAIIILIISILLFSIIPEAMVLIFCFVFLLYSFNVITNYIKNIEYTNKIKDMENFKNNGGEYLISKFHELFNYNYSILIISKKSIRKNQYIVSKNNLKIIFYLNNINKISIRGSIEGVKIDENLTPSINSYEQIKIRDEVAIKELNKIIDEFIEFFDNKIKIFMTLDFVSLKGLEIIAHDMNYKKSQIIINIKYINNSNFKLKTDNKNYSIRLAEYDLKNSDNKFYIEFDKNNKKVLAFNYMEKGNAILEISYQKWIYYRVNRQIIFTN